MGRLWAVEAGPLAVWPRRRRRRQQGWPGTGCPPGAGSRAAGAAPRRGRRGRSTGRSTPSPETLLPPLPAWSYPTSDRPARRLLA